MHYWAFQLYMFSGVFGLMLCADCALVACWNMLHTFEDLRISSAHLDMGEHAWGRCLCYRLKCHCLGGFSSTISRLSKIDRFCLVWILVNLHCSYFQCCTPLWWPQSGLPHRLLASETPDLSGWQEKQRRMEHRHPKNGDSGGNHGRVLLPQCLIHLSYQL